MTTVWGSPTVGTPRRSSAESSASWLAMKLPERVRLMNPGPLTSTSAQTSSREAAATTSSASSDGSADLLGQGQGAVGLEVGAVGGPQDRVCPFGHRVEGRLKTAE